MTATTKFLAGSVFNLMERGTLYSSDENQYFPRENVADRDPSVPFKFGNIQEDGWIKVDLNHVTNGDMETWEGSVPDVPEGWTFSGTLSGTTAKAPESHEGSYALKCATGAGGGSGGAIAPPLTFRSGESVQLDLYMMAFTAGSVARVRIFNATTGHYLTAKGLWQTPVADCQTETDHLDYVHHTQQFTIEDYSTCKADAVTLLLKCYVSGTSQDARFDDVYLYPGFNFFSVHGHNFEPRNTLGWYYADNDVSGVGDSPAPYTPISNSTIARPSFYGITSSGTVLYHRWVKFIQSGAPYAAAGSIGELVLGQYQTLTTDAQHPAQAAWSWNYVRPQVINVTQTGRQIKTNLTDYRQRTLTMPYFQKTDASFVQFREEIMDRTQDGALPLVIVPNDSKGDVIYGQIANEFTDRQAALVEAHATDLTVVEMPFGLDGL